MASQDRHEVGQDSLIADPARHFSTPMDVVDDAQLNLGVKRAILESWKKDAELLSVAASENMAGGEPALPSLQDVSVALERLETLEQRRH